MEQLGDGVRLAPEQVPGASREAREFFAGEGVPYAWWVGPSTAPADLGNLAGGGLSLLEESKGWPCACPRPRERRSGESAQVRVVPVRD